ncbi:hypothetical protein [Microcystis phage Mvi-JY20]|uniref:Uncharacterized protein n=1 Tax=Microcystis phage Mvi-JY20 TaxID=3128146 RepID=A0AAX4QGW8_9CAUD
MIPRDHKHLRRYALKVLEEVSFPESPLLTDVWPRFIDDLADELAANAYQYGHDWGYRHRANKEENGE